MGPNWPCRWMTTCASECSWNEENGYIAIQFSLSQLGTASKVFISPSCWMSQHAYWDGLMGTLIENGIVKLCDGVISIVVFNPVNNCKQRQGIYFEFPYLPSEKN